MGTEIDVNISNGTCYFDPWEESSSNIIPCGNAANGVYSCCQEGDVCLVEGACFNADHRTTYMAGCTDPNFADTSCPQKDTSNQQLLGLVQCEGDDATTTVGTATTVLWSGCPGPTSRTALGAPSACACTGTADGGLIWMTSSLAAVATLPASLGGQIVWAADATLTSEAAGSLYASETGSASASAVSNAGGGSGGLSGGAKAGIAVVVVLLSTIVLVAIGVIVFIRRRKKSQFAGSMRLQTPDPGLEVGVSRQGTAVGDGGDPWNGENFMGYKAELPAEPRWMSRVELPGDDAVYGGTSKRIEDEEPRGTSTTGAGIGNDAAPPVSPISLSRTTPDDGPTGMGSEVSSVFTVSRMGSLLAPGGTYPLQSITETHGR